MTARDKNRVKIIAIVAIIAVLVAVVVIIKCSDMEKPYMMFLGNSYEGDISIPQECKDALIPFDMEQRGTVHFYAEGDTEGKAVLEKQDGESWNEVAMSKEGTDGDLTLHTYADAGKYRISLEDTSHKMWIEMGHTYYGKPPVNIEKAKLIEYNGGLTDIYAPEEQEDRWYKFVIGEEGEYTMELYGGSGPNAMDMILTIYDSQMSKMEQKETEAEDDYGTSIKVSYITRTLEKGTYYAQVSKADADAIGEYCFNYYTE